MNASISSKPLRPAGFMVLVLICFSFLPAQNIRDLNLTQRIALTLANSLSDRYQFGPGEVKELMSRPDIYLDEQQGVYSYSFRFTADTFQGSGYFRIAEPVGYRRPKTEEGWNLQAEDKDTGARVWFRQVRKSEVVRYNEVEATLENSRFILTASLRRPAEEPALQAQQEILGRLNRLISNARRYGLLTSVVLEWVRGEGGQALGPEQLLNIVGQAKKETRVRFKMYAVDAQGLRLPGVDYYSIKLKGLLGSFARLEGATFNPKLEQFEVHDPPAQGAQVVLIIPSLDDAAFGPALEENSRRSDDFGIVLDVDATFKSERKGAES